MERVVSFKFSGEALATLESLAARRRTSVSDVLASAVSHELWLEQSSAAGRLVVSEGKYDREELVLDRLPAHDGSSATTRS